jgi:RNA-directed DNA polymerase
VLSERNLQAAFWAVWRNEGAPGVDGQTVKQFDEHAETELARLREELHTKRYRRQAARRVWIPKPGTTEKRPLGIPAVRDRTVEAATRNVLEPIFERDFAEHSYGFRPGRGCREAVGRVEELLSQGHVWCVDADLKSYFDTIPHEGLMALVKQRIVDGSVLALLEQCLKAGVLEELRGWQPTERGTPQGASSVRFWQTSTSIRWTTRWRSGDGRWCATRTTSSCCAAGKKKPRLCWHGCVIGRRRQG